MEGIEEVLAEAPPAQKGLFSSFPHGVVLDRHHQAVGGQGGDGRTIPLVETPSQDPVALLMDGECS